MSVKYRQVYKFTYTQHTIQYDMRQHIHVHAIIQAVWCGVQTEMWKKKQLENKQF